MVKIWQLIGGGPLATGAPSHGTTGTMDNPSLPWSLPVTRQRRRSHDSICYIRKPHAARQLHGSVCCRIGSFEVLYCGNNREFRAFCTCDLDLDPMTFIYELDSYHLKSNPQIENEISASTSSRLSQVIVLYRVGQKSKLLYCGL